MKIKYQVNQSNYNNNEDPSNFDFLYQSLYPVLVSKASRILSSQVFAHDIVQDVFIRYWGISSEPNIIKEPQSFLMKMVFNASMGKKRKDDLHRTFIKCFDMPDLVSNITQRMVDSIEYERLLQEAIATLPPQRKRVFVLGKLEGWQRLKIAAAFGISDQTVKETMRQAQKTVRNYIADKMSEEFKNVEKSTVRNRERNILQSRHIQY